MSKELLKRSRSIYGFVLNFYPADYRREFGDEMKYVFSQSLKDSYEKNEVGGVIKFWIKTIYDFIKSVFIQHWQNQKGGGFMKSTNKDIFEQNKLFVWLAATTAAILMVPLVAMQFSNEVAWTFSDFSVMGMLIFGLGSLYILTARKLQKNRLVIGILFLFLFLWIWAELAVGVFTSIGS